MSTYVIKFKKSDLRGSHMKIIHCADVHLDSKMTANLTKEKAKERKSELLNTFTRMIEYAKNNDVSAIIIAGDLFDTKNISVTAGKLVLNTIIGNPDIDFYYVRGNHDVDGFLSNMESIPDNLKLFDNKWTSYSMNAVGSVVITGVEIDSDNSNYIYSNLTLDADKFNIVCLHGQESEHGAKDKAEVINLRELKYKGIDYLALGHIHSFKMAELDSRGVYCYPGCLEGRGFDECGEHGFVLLDIDDNTGKCTNTFVPFAYRNLYTLQVDVTDAMSTSEISEILKASLNSAGYSDKSLVKIILTGMVDVQCEKNTDVLLKQFSENYYFMKIYDETKLKVDYNLFMRDESLKGEFVRTVKNAETISEEEKAAIIKLGIQLLAGEEIEL